MLQISGEDSYNLWFDYLVPPFSFSSPFRGQEFVLILIMADLSIKNDDRDALSREIVRLGCRYAVCTGHQCSKWENSIDLAYLATIPELSPPDERFVMTTSHENEPLEDVIRFFRYCTAFDNFTPRNYLAVILGADQELREVVSSALKIGFGSHG